MRIKSIAGLMLAAVLTVNLFGCGSGNKFDREKWTKETLTNSITLCGEKLSYPVTAESLGRSFTLTNKQANGEGATADLQHDGSKVCVLRFECAPDQINDKSEASRLIFVPDESQKEVLSINGFTAKDSLKDAKSKIGEPTEEKGATLYYKTSDNGRLEIVGGAGEDIFAINLYFEN